jgi:hypothetical protein
MAESGEDLLRGLRPLRAGEVEEGGREGEKKWVGAPFLHGQQVAQNVQEKNAHLGFVGLDVGHIGHESGDVFNG